jgi:hypothetical protein
MRVAMGVIVVTGVTGWAVMVENSAHRDSSGQAG